MKKSYVFLLIFLFIVGVGIGIYYYNTHNSNTSNNSNSQAIPYNSTKVGTNTEIENTNEQKQEDSVQQTQETEIADFSTKIYTKDKDRQNNITITCSTLNNTTVSNGDTFSFCSTVGKATTSKGYEKADVYKDGKVVQALGGGNCQVSTTLYNAVLKVDSLKVTERHEHSNSVPYISKGKDAAVAYGSYDFKFVNNSGNTIKITASNDKNNVYIKIYKIS